MERIVEDVEGFIPSFAERHLNCLAIFDRFTMIT